MSSLTKKATCRGKYSLGGRFNLFWDKEGKPCYGLSFANMPGVRGILAFRKDGIKLTNISELVKELLVPNPDFHALEPLTHDLERRLPKKVIDVLAQAQERVSKEAFGFALGLCHALYIDNLKAPSRTYSFAMAADGNDDKNSALLEWNTPKSIIVLTIYTMCDEEEGPPCAELIIALKDPKRPAERSRTSNYDYHRNGRRLVDELTQLLSRR